MNSSILSFDLLEEHLAGKVIRACVYDDASQLTELLQKPTRVFPPCIIEMISSLETPSYTLDARAHAQHLVRMCIVTSVVQHSQETFMYWCQLRAVPGDDGPHIMQVMFQDLDNQSSFIFMLARCLSVDHFVPRSLMRSLDISWLQTVLDTLERSFGILKQRTSLTGLLSLILHLSLNARDPVIDTPQREVHLDALAYWAGETVQKKILAAGPGVFVKADDDSSYSTSYNMLLGCLQGYVFPMTTDDAVCTGRRRICNSISEDAARMVNIMMVAMKMKTSEQLALRSKICTALIKLHDAALNGMPEEPSEWHMETLLRASQMHAKLRLSADESVYLRDSTPRRDVSCAPGTG